MCVEFHLTGEFICRPYIPHSESERQLRVTNRDGNKWENLLEEVEEVYVSAVDLGNSRGIRGFPKVGGWHTMTDRGGALRQIDEK